MNLFFFRKKAHRELNFKKITRYAIIINAFQIVAALGIALYAMFIAIVVPPSRRSKAVAVTALVAVGLACLFRYLPGLRLIPSGWALILAAVAAAAFAALRFPVEDSQEGGGTD